MNWRIALPTAILAALWMLLLGRSDPLDVLVGVAVGYAAIRFSRPVVGTSRRERAARPTRRRAPPGPVDLAGRFAALARLAGLYLYEVTRTNLMMTRDVLSPRPDVELGIFALEVPELGPVEMTVLANLIGLTPGSIAIDYDEAERTLYIQTVYAQDVETMKEDYRRFALLICRVTGRGTPGAAEGGG